MIKYFCDRCGKEISEKCRIILTDFHWMHYVIKGSGPVRAVCEECSDKLDTIKGKIENEEDFLDMTDEDIELLRYTFKVGDEVITSTGEVGHIDWICDCDNCKERGFYEPHVEVEIGVDSIYITDNDKMRGFRSFYKIGNRVFGNIDEDCLDYDIQSKKSQIQELQEGLIQLNAQKDVLKKIKENNNEI